MRRANAKLRRKVRDKRSLTFVVASEHVLCTSTHTFDARKCAVECVYLLTVCFADLCLLRRYAGGHLTRAHWRWISSQRLVLVVAQNNTPCLLHALFHSLKLAVRAKTATSQMSSASVPF